MSFHSQVKRQAQQSLEPVLRFGKKLIRNWCAMRIGCEFSEQHMISTCVAVFDRHIIYIYNHIHKYIYIFIYVCIYIYILIYGPGAWGPTRSCVHAPPPPPHIVWGLPHHPPHSPAPHPPYPPPTHSHGGEGYIDICVYTYIYILYQHGNGSIRFG